MICQKHNIYHKIQGDFFNWPPPEFAKCWPVRNRFRKNLRVPDWPPLYDQKKSKCLRTPMWFSYLQDLGGASRGIFGGGQSRDILRGGPVKKITLYKWVGQAKYVFLVATSSGESISCPKKQNLLLQISKRQFSQDFPYVGATLRARDFFLTPSVYTT